jgi:hypothetical protein
LRHPIVEDDDVIYVGSHHPGPHHYWTWISHQWQYLAYAQHSPWQQHFAGAGRYEVFEGGMEFNALSTLFLSE